MKQTSALQLHFPFDGSLTDVISGQAATGTGSIAYVDSVHSQALVLDGTTSYLSFTGGTLAALTGDLTLALWVYGAGPVGEPMTLVEGLKNSQSVLRIDLTNDQTIATFTVMDQTVERQPSPCFFYDQWNFWCSTHTPSTGIMKILINGTVVAQISDATVPLGGLDTLRIGASAQTDQFYAGYVDDVRFYDQELTMQEIWIFWRPDGRTAPPRPTARI